MLENPSSKADLNAGPGEKVRAAVAVTLFASGVLAIAGLVSPWMPALLLVLGLVMSSSLLSLFYRRNGPLFALGGLLFHQVYYVYSSLAFAWCYIGHGLGLLRKAW